MSSKVIHRLFQYAPWQDIVVGNEQMTAGSAEQAHCVFVKVVTHLEGGIGVLVYNGMDTLWLCVLSTEELSAFLVKHFPSVDLQLTAVLLGIEECLHRSPGEDKNSFISLQVQDASSLGSFREEEEWVAPVDKLEVTLRLPLEVLRDYSIGLEIPAVCKLLESNAKEWRTLFSQAVVKPLCAQRLALAEAFLHVCQESGKTPESVAEHLSQSYKENISASATTHSGWLQSQRSVAANLLRTVSLPQPLRCFASFEQNLIRFVNGEANDFISADFQSTPQPAETPSSGGKRVREAEDEETTGEASTKPVVKKAPPTVSNTRKVRKLFS
ncbi:hypothetical protein ADEAN_000010100 [Angomonas deanei]|uniref:Uncharacterized protein n=1 Tax=Angomonas deanei TaxID=59799 RepID=A0A7G2BYN6_9TRYP|nr:hypothetical protein ADEAN_000010100 [Angomonas deanei]